jgi:hypothetical protein
MTMEQWSTGVMEYWIQFEGGYLFSAILQYSITPTLQFFKSQTH